jgi:hypothetical protein
MIRNPVIQGCAADQRAAYVAVSEDSDEALLLRDERDLYATAIDNLQYFSKRRRTGDAG